MNHKGTIKLETERLILRRFEENDALDMYNNWANDKDVTKYLPWIIHDNIDVKKKRIISWLNEYDKENRYNWAIVPKEYGKVIGSISPANIKEKQQRCDVGYCMSKKYWNKGIMTKALKTILKFLFEEINFNRVQAMHNSENTASGKVMLKAGMKYEGRLKEYQVNKSGEFIDSDVYAIVKSDYNST